MNGDVVHRVQQIQFNHKYKMLNTVENTYLWLLHHIFKQNETVFWTIIKLIFQKSKIENEIDIARYADLHFCFWVRFFDLINTNQIKNFISFFTTKWLPTFLISIRFHFYLISFYLFKNISKEL